MRRQNITRIFFAVIALLVLLGTGVGISILLSQSNLSANDTGALYGGQVETGYGSTGFMVNFLQTSGAEFCGVVMLTANSGLTAAHCLDNPGEKYVGQGEFTTDKSKLVKIGRSVQKVGWDQRTSNNDLAVFELEGPLAISTGKLLPELTDDCNYRVVAYGRTEEELEEMGAARLRKSAKVCLAEIDDNLVRLTSTEGGICVGDSGSPIYREGTTEVAALISAVTKPNRSSPYCFVGNIALAVRVDSNRTFVTANDEIDLPESVFASAAEVPVSTPGGSDEDDFDDDEDDEATATPSPTVTPTPIPSATVQPVVTTQKGIDFGLVLILAGNLVALAGAGYWLYRTTSNKTTVATTTTTGTAEEEISTTTTTLTPTTPAVSPVVLAPLPPLPDLPAPKTLLTGTGVTAAPAPVAATTPAPATTPIPVPATTPVPAPTPALVPTVTAPASNPAAAPSNPVVAPTAAVATPQPAPIITPVLPVTAPAAPITPAPLPTPPAQ